MGGDERRWEEMGGDGRRWEEMRGDEIKYDKETMSNTSGEVGSGADTVEFEEDWSQKWILIENSL